MCLERERNLGFIVKIRKWNMIITRGLFIYDATAWYTLVNDNLTSFLYISSCCSICKTLGSSLNSLWLFRCSNLCRWASSRSDCARRIAIRSSANRPRARSSFSSDSKSFTVSDKCWLRRRSSSTYRIEIEIRMQSKITKLLKKILRKSFVTFRRFYKVVSFFFWLSRQSLSNFNQINFKIDLNLNNLNILRLKNTKILRILCKKCC